jgi:hypothetical protein
MSTIYHEPDITKLAYGVVEVLPAGVVGGHHIVGTAHLGIGTLYQLLFNKSAEIFLSITNQQALLHNQPFEYRSVWIYYICLPDPDLDPQKNHADPTKTLNIPLLGLCMIIACSVEEKIMGAP